jgi:hypothetical protein
VVLVPHLQTKEVHINCGLKEVIECLGMPKALIFNRLSIWMFKMIFIDNLA